MSESLLGIVCLSIHPGLAPTLGAGAIPIQMGLVMTIHTPSFLLPQHEAQPLSLTFEMFPHRVTT